MSFAALPVPSHPQSYLTRQVRRARRARWAYVFLLPSIVLLIGLKFVPAGLAILLSLFNWNGRATGAFVGLQNFQDLAADPVFRQSFLNLGVYIAGIVALTLGPPLLAAELVMGLRRPRIQFAFRTLLVIPLVVPTIVILLVWRFLYNPLVGPLNQLLAGFGIGPVLFLADPNIAMASVLFVGFPWCSGIAFLIYLAGLQAIPTDLWDAAEIDGAQGLRRFLSFDLPLILSEVRILVVLGIIAGIQSFGTILVLTFGGPRYTTMVPGLYMYLQAFQSGRFGYATAIGVVLFVFVLALTAVTLRAVRSSTAYDPTGRA